eukprot:952121-Pleurochrysis_carterae.AAC.5
MSCPSVDDPPSNSTLGGCKCSRGRMELYLPLALDFECDWPAPVRAILYLALLAWCFLGVAIIANIFMEVKTFFCVQAALSPLALSPSRPRYPYRRYSANLYQTEPLPS